MQINPKFNIGQVVYLKTDPEQLPRIVISILIGADSLIQYRLMCGTEESLHYAIEIDAEKDVIKLMMNYAYH